MEKVLDTYFKAVRLDGTSHWDKKTKWVIGELVSAPVSDKDRNGEPCGVGIHGSPTLLDAVHYQRGPSLYLRFVPVGEMLGEDNTKARFESVIPTKFLTEAEVDELAGFKLWEANHPFNPFSNANAQAQPMDETWVKEQVKQWASVWDSVWDSVRDSVWASVGASVWASVGASVWDSVRDSVRASVWDSVWDSVGDSVGDSVRASVGNSVWDSVRASVGASVWDSVWDSVGASVWDSVGASVGAYAGGLFPSITVWKGAEHLGSDPWRPLLDLWYKGYVPAYDNVNKKWFVCGGPNADVLFTFTKQEIEGQGETK